MFLAMSASAGRGPDRSVVIRRACSHRTVPNGCPARERYTHGTVIHSSARWSRSQMTVMS